MAVDLTTETVSRQNVLRKIQDIATRLRRRQLIGSRTVALEVIRLLREIVSHAKFTSFQQLVLHLQEVGKILQTAGPKELVVTNMTRRIILLISEEYETALTNYLADPTNSSSPQSPNSIPQTPALGFESGGLGGTSFFSDRERESGGSSTNKTSRTANNSHLGSLFDLLGHKTANSIGLNSTSGTTSAFATPPPLSTMTSPQNSAPNSPSSSQTLPARPSLPLRTPSSVTPHVEAVLQEEFSRKSFSLKPVFIEAIQELMEEVEFTHKTVGEQSIDHIHSGEFIFTIGHSKTVEAFLKTAARKRKFTVIVAETAPEFSGRSLALSLSAANIPTILIPDSNIFALLPRCSKVLLGPHLVLADGAALALAGSLPLCLAANRLRVPVVVIGGMFKFSPVYLGEADWAIRDLGSPDQILKIPHQENSADETEILNPYFDLVPPNLISLYITNLGGHPSSLLYRLLSETYGGAT